jgi:cytidine deaminase
MGGFMHNPSTTQPDKSAAQPDTTAAKPDKTCAQPGKTAAQPGKAASQPGKAATEAGRAATEPALLRLLGMAHEAAQRAYAPYSGFRVGAAIRLTNGAIVTGVNVENASYGLTICAERSALARAVSQFGPEMRVEAIAVANLNNAPSPPCGACRQVLAEFAEPEAVVIFPAADGPRAVPFHELLPLAFEIKPK